MVDWTLSEKLDANRNGLLLEHLQLINEVLVFTVGILCQSKISRIILSQEKNIQRLNELVRSLREQLLQCRSNNETIKGTDSSLSGNIIELE
ncbi:unnamed protein product [Thlaspi arvense]|uniref:Uncharacterized protein n=1 Tax=Thlaspi arvense TaxID=13288 RepID=A0AAU9RIZ1_THLAR|nr:unnamed protein product [Thlaspi arvense]